MKVMMIGAIALGGVWLGAIAPPPSLAAETTNESAQFDTVQANITATRSEDGFCLEEPVQLTIQRQGMVRLDTELAGEDLGLCLISQLSVQHLDADTEPEVILDVFTGGAHCCTISYIFGYNPTTQTYDRVDHYWGNGGYGLQDRNQDGHPEFHSADDSFAYAFASYAASQRPLQIWQYQDGAMTDITRRFPTLVYGDATQLWQNYTANRGDYQELDRAYLASYLADKYMLGQAEDGWERVRATYQWGDRAVFFRDLAVFLQDTGYAPGLTTERISFAPNTVGLTLQGAIAPLERNRYSLDCLAGQTFTLDLEQGAVRVALISPWGEELGVVTANQARRQVVLPESGDYHVDVTTDRQSRYQLTLQVR